MKHNIAHQSNKLLVQTAEKLFAAGSPQESDSSTVSLQEERDGFPSLLWEFDWWKQDQTFEDFFHPQRTGLWHSRRPWCSRCYCWKGQRLTPIIECHCLWKGSIHPFLCAHMGSSFCPSQAEYLPKIHPVTLRPSRLWFFGQGMAFSSVWKHILSCPTIEALVFWISSQSLWPLRCINVWPQE